MEEMNEEVLARDGAGDDERVNRTVEEDEGLTPEEEAEQEAERQRIREAMIGPYRTLAEAVKEHDDMMAETLYELTMLEIGEE